MHTPILHCAEQAVGSPAIHNSHNYLISGSYRIYPTSHILEMISTPFPKQEEDIKVTQAI
jgi:hypothetical protein